MFDRRIAFVVGCIGSRTAAALVARRMYTYPPIIRKLLILGAMAIAISLWFHFIFKTREYAIEAQGPVWWNEMRPVHAVMLLLFAQSAVAMQPEAWMYLLADVCIAVTFWVSMGKYKA